MFVEAFVFNCDDRLFHDVGDVRGGDDDPLLVVEAGDDTAIGVEELGFFCGFDDFDFAGEIVED